MATKYQVAAGDTFPSLAEQFYRDPELARALAAANRLPVTTTLLVGQEVLIPYITRRHTVAPGETLGDVAERYYADTAMVPLLAAANHIDATTPIRAGDRLLVPDLLDVSRHTIFPGDTIAEFARRWYNDERCATVIECANHFAAQEHLQVGQEIVRPGLNRRHTVEPGETWCQLAQCWYGDPTLDRLIAAANRLSVHDSPPAGRVLFFPDLADF